MPKPRRCTKKFADLVAAVIPNAARSKPIELWWQDEARIGQQGSLTRIWARRGSRPTAPRDQRYQSAYLFGAVCPDRGVGAGLVLPRANVHAMNLHLQEISTLVSPGAFAVLTLDGAGWHQAGDRLMVPDNIALLHLPPYSPELNPVENVWEFLRHNDLREVVGQIRTDVTAAWLMRRTRQEPHEIRGPCQGRAPVRSDQAGVRLCQGALSRPGEEHEAAVGHCGLTNLLIVRHRLLRA